MVWVLTKCFYYKIIGAKENEILWFCGKKFSFEDIFFDIQLVLGAVQQPVYINAQYARE